MVGLKARKKAKRGKGRATSSLTYDVVCVGRPVQDTILSGDIFSPVCSHGTCYEHIPLGSKLAVEKATVSYGGNALNSSVTMARQNLSVALLGQVGEDSISQDVLSLLHQEGVDTSLLLQGKGVEIGLSTIISAPGGERSVLAYPGSEISHQEVLASLEDVEARWLYVSSLNSMELLEGVMRFAELNQIKVAFNPGGLELEKIEETKRLLKNVEVLILNKEEAAKFFGPADFTMLPKLGAKYVKICIVTDGPNGARAFDGQIDYFEPISSDVEVIDRNGAGDAFASGVIAGLALGMDLKTSLGLGSRNSTSVVQKVGAQEGILRVDK